MDMDQGIRNISICVYMSKPRCRFVSFKRPRPQAPRNSASSLSVNDVEPNAAPWFAEVAVYGMAWLGARLGDVCLCVCTSEVVRRVYLFGFLHTQSRGDPQKRQTQKLWASGRPLTRLPSTFHSSLPSLLSLKGREGNRREGWMIRQLLSRIMEYLAFSDRHTNTGIG